MKKRWICAFLAAVMLFGMVSVASVSVQAASALKTSESCITLIKQLEGFQPTPKLDYSQYSVGYGSACEKGDYPEGITEAQADVLLRADLAEIEASLNKFADKYSLTFNQGQFDALVSFTYNVGSNWMNDTEGMFRNAVVKGQKGNDFIFAITRWSTAGTGENKSVRLGLVERRLIEANLYLNGVYSHSVPANFTYVLYNTNISDCTNTVRIQGYDSSVGDTVKATPTKTGYRFLGWYSAAEGGKWITALNASNAGTTLYGHWQKGEGEVDANGCVVGTAASYVLYAAPDGSQVVHQQPNAEAAEVRKLEGNAEVTIVADYIDNSGAKWGQLSDGGWISLTEASEEIEPIEKLENPLTLTVTHSEVNIRFGPGTKYEKVGKAYKGQQITITGVQKGGIYLWGKFSGGWICLDYTDYETVLAQSKNESAVVTGLGTVVKTSKVNVRSGPGTNYPKAGTLAGGTTVKVLGQTTVNGKVWYQTEAGWIHSYYLEVTPVEEGDLATTAPTETTAPSETTAPTGSDTTQDKTEVIDTGVVFNCSTLRIRAGAGTKYECVGKLAAGTRVEIYEYTVVNGAVWGRINLGWIHMSYVKMDETTSTESGTVMGTVVNCTKVNVRSGAGTGYAKVGQLAAGTKVQVLQLMQLSNGKIWARIAQGWVHTDYLQLEQGSASGSAGSSSSGTENTGSTGSAGTSDGASSGTSTGTATGIVAGETSDVILTGTVIGTDSLRVRSGPGTGYEQVGTMARGTRVKILEQTNVSRTTWGRTEQGWISLYYVQLDAATSVEGAVTKTVTADTLHIRSGAGTEYENVADYHRGNKIVILEQVTVDGRSWGRTDLGWVCMDYVK